MRPISLIAGPLLGSAREPRRDRLVVISEPHVVPPSAMAVWALAKGPSGRRLEFSRKTLSGDPPGGIAERGQTALLEAETPTSALFTELAMTVLNLCRVLPPAGVVCFFTAYEIAHAFTAFLRRSGYYEQINAVKRIFVEGELSNSHTTKTTTSIGNKRERDCAVLPERLEEDHVGDLPPSSPMPFASLGQGEEAAGVNNRGVEALLAEYRSYILGGECDRGGTPDPTPSRSTGRHPTGALLFAVMGGRLSEGINFSDDLGRAVLVVGVPYANPTDLELQLNLRHIAAMTVTSGGDIESTANQPHHEQSLSTITTAFIGGEGGNRHSHTERSLAQAQWELYTDLCMRTVNQCIGRCIRHSQDYAAVVLLDARYAERADIQRRIPSWIQPSLKKASNFGECFRGVRDFFAQR
ncbi:unnamed protein product [Phytomonas sp. Hart1]|nr:unnamed protein product [Phytomonas sp. Hart1]|eukprot:CCW69733.1 unnamed protein product [Phytomonas sp. isolate Hart1]